MKKVIVIVLCVLGGVLLTCVGVPGYIVYRFSRVVEAKHGAWPVSLREARDAHETVLWKREAFSLEDLPAITDDSLEYTIYEGPLGAMRAIASKVQYGRRRPAVIWDFGGFGGIFDGYADKLPPFDDQSVRQFLDRDIVVFLPTVRGEYQNPGVFECFYGEVDDLVAAVEHVAQRPDVDPEQIYLMGHSTGGTNVLLASMLTDIPAAVVSFGGAPDMDAIIQTGGYGVEPYDKASQIEVDLRSPIRFTKYIRCPVLYIEGSQQNRAPAMRMQREALKYGVPFTAVVVQGADHWSTLAPIKALLAERIASGRGLSSMDAIQKAFTDSQGP